MESFFKEYRVDDISTIKLNKEFEDILSNMALFSIIWSIGAALEETTRIGFHEFLTKLITADASVCE